MVFSISPTHPEYGDIGIVLENGQNYYINPADEVAHLDWEKMLSDLNPGDEVHLTVVTPHAWRLLGLERQGPHPVAGLRTDDTVYMDKSIAENTWTAHRNFSRIALMALVVLFVCITPEIGRFFNHSPLLKGSGT